MISAACWVIKYEFIEVTIILIFTFYSAVCSSKEYSTTELREIADLLGKKNVSYKEIVDSTSGMVVHLGLDLFEEPQLSDSLRSINVWTPNPIMLGRFIERYALKMYLLPSKESSQIMMNKNVFMDVKKLSKTSKADTFMCFMDSSKFTVSWFMNEVSFPNDLSLILGMNKKEMDSLFLNKVHSYMETLRNDSLSIDIKETYVDSASYIAKSGDYYYIEDMSQTLFFTKAGKDSLLPIYNEKYPKETVSNLFHSLVLGDFILDIEQNMYGYKTSNYSIPLSIFSKICKDEGCSTYIGIESLTDTEVNVVVLYKNKYFSYNHLLSSSFCIEDIKAKNGNIKSSLYVNIPTTNLKSLFGEENNGWR